MRDDVFLAEEYLRLWIERLAGVHVPAASCAKTVLAELDRLRQVVEDERTARKVLEETIAIYCAGQDTREGT